MKILGIDTSSRFNTIGLISGNQILADFTWESRDSLQKIILNIDLVLRNGGLTLADVDRLAVGLGPGSWTGVRVGVTVGKILAYAMNKPICGVSSLDALAYQARNMPILLCPLIDAGKENVYAAFYRPQGETIVKESDYYVGDIKGLLKTIKEPVLFLGKAAYLYRQIIVEELGPLANYRGEVGDVQKGYVIALLALPRFERGESDDALSLAPLYLKESLAQALLAGEKRIQTK
ncbi:MAG: tRNA (adenosine(37)-N6)-threonylcarbamoyltransferase complex dimerization subunit type 1 TsaB [Dehalococcoidia bacterium]|nr:MAG: tRNA (adenosine(37)-N6)-threonylcarbamoyltransferase complex dimerization subunit type 1 TsaB [Dehalococcoidia bacterium]